MRPTFIFRFLLLALAAILFVACGDDEEDVVVTSSNSNANVVTTQPEVSRLEMPRLKGGNSILLVHKTNDSYDPVNFSVEWDCDKKSQRWTCYEMHKGYGGSAGYYGEFMEDPDVPSDARFSDTNAMYRGSGFTRGHICPSADRQYSRAANKQTFYYTNMQPQYYNFNAGDNYSGFWVKMEAQLRTWTSTSGYDTIYVCKGGTIDKEEQILARIKNELIVPKYFFVALLCKNSQGYKALGFWAKHDNQVRDNVNIADYVVSIHELEELTDIDFFCNLPDDIEAHVENLPVENIKRAWGLK